MNQFLNGFIPKAYRIRINGKIDQKLLDAISRGLQKSWPSRPTSLLVTINSSGGSIVQARNIADLLKVYSNRYNVPIITFVEDQCLNSANLILTTGVRCYASPFSMIGDMGYSWSSLWFSRFAKKYDVNQEYIYSPENKVKFNPFEEIKPESETWMKNYLYELEHALHTAVSKNRSEAFAKKGLDRDSLDQKIFNAGILDPEEYVKLGLLDGLRTYNQEIKEKYSSSKIYEINPPRKLFRESLAQSALFH